MNTQNVKGLFNMAADSVDHAIFISHEYDKFKKIVNNRAVDDALVNKIVSSIKRSNDLRYKPIDVNENMEVLDGQHRLEASKRLNLPVYYQIIQDNDEGYMVRHNTATKNWTAMDFLNYFAEQGNPHYMKLREFMSYYDLTLNAAMVWLKGHTVRRKVFDNGLFTFELRPSSQRGLNHYLAFRKYLVENKLLEFKVCTSPKFVTACQVFFGSAAVSAVEFMEQKLPQHGKRFIKRQFTTEAWLDDFVSIYNFRRSKHNIGSVASARQNKIVSV